MAGAWCDPNGRSGRVGNNATLRLPALLHGPVRAAFQPTAADQHVAALTGDIHLEPRQSITVKWTHVGLALCTVEFDVVAARSEEHTSELQSQSNLVCRLLLEKKKNHHGGTSLLVSHL